MKIHIVTSRPHLPLDGHRSFSHHIIYIYIHNILGSYTVKHYHTTYTPVIILYKTNGGEAAGGVGDGGGGS